ncbi:glycosyltransferase family 39 protein [Kitasatospora sp. NPDC057223]|uniref:glycosyltransferase family 39 protein n=1 Tax=Kitasatospora sp. NPDC057223 TaxID=3346055 RepID=UPI00363BCDFE
MNSNALARAVTRLTGRVWFWPALVTLLVGGWRLSTPQLWRDEISTWTASTRGLGELAQMLQHVDASNGVYYVIMHGWTTVLGDSPVMLRLPSVLAMAGAAAFSALTAERLFRSRAAGVAGGLLLVVLPAADRYAQEARAYALVACAVSAATWLLLRALDRPGFGRWAGYSACMALAGGAHLVSLSTLSGQLPLVLLHLWSTRRAVKLRLLWQYPLAVLAAVLPVVPLIVLGSRQSGRQLGWLAAPGTADLRLFWDVLLSTSTVFHLFLALAALTLLWPGRRLAGVQLLLLAVVPVVVVWAVSQGSTSYFLDRYLLFTLPAWASLAGGGVGALYAAARRLAPVPVCAVLALAVVAVPGWLVLPQQRAIRGAFGHDWHQDYRSAAGLIAAGYRPGDGLVAPYGEQNWTMIGAGVDFYLPDGVRPYPVFLRSSAAEADDLYPVECAVAAQCVGQGGRIWLVTTGEATDPLPALSADKAQALRAHYAPTEVRQVRGLTVTLLTRTG